MKKVVSIDGGGIRGIVAAYLLMKIEEELGDHLCNYVDLAAGTSTGSILAVGIARGMSMKQVLDLYMKEGPNIFKASFRHKVKSLGGLRGGKYELEKFNGILDRYFKEENIGSLKTDFLATAYNMTDGKPRFFSKQESDIKLKDVICASSAAPTYFDPQVIVGKSYVDGGVFCTNPAMSAFAEIKQLHNVPAEKIFLLSVGNGDRSEEYSGMAKWNKLKWVSPLIDLMMTSDAGIVHYQLVRIYKSVNKPDNYWRLNSKLPDNINTDLADASPENMEALLEYAKDMAKKNVNKIKLIAKKLKSFK